MNKTLNTHPKMANLLENWLADAIYAYVKLLGGPTSLRRKKQRIDYICQQLLTPSLLQKHWQTLDDITKKAVSTAYHNDGTFNSYAFLAQYDDYPKRPITGRSHYATYKNPILFDLFIINGAIPSDLLPLLAPHVLPEDRFQIEVVEDGSLSNHIKHPYSGEQAPLHIIETETIGRVDLLTCLRMIEQGEIKFSSSNRLITAGSMKKLHAQLVDGDLVANPEKMTNKFVIRPFGLAVFAYHSNFVTRQGNITKLGRDYLASQDSNLFEDAFAEWVENGKFEELTRVEGLKGVRSKKTHLTHSGERREKIIEALSWCPTGKWIEINQFFRAMQAWEFDIELEDSPYYNLSTEDHYWEMSRNEYHRDIIHPYIEIILVEYLASLGLIDIGYFDFDANENSILTSTTPQDIYQSFYYFRINDWGAYILGIHDEYEMVKTAEQAKFTVDEQLRLTLAQTILPGDKLFVELISTPIDDKLYQLDTTKLLDTVQNGQSFALLRSFLLQGVETAVPELTAWLDQLEQNSKAIKQKHKAIVYTVKPDVMRLSQEDDLLRKLSMVLDPKTLLIPAGNDNRFRKRLKILGYLIM